MSNLQGKTALITGGSKGIGFGIAEALLAQGMRVAITSRSRETVEEASNQLEERTTSNLEGVRCMGIVADVRDMKEQEQAVEAVLEEWGKLDVLVANAGLGHFASIEEMTPEQWHETIDTNLTGVFNSIKAGVGALKATQGYFITIASLAGTNFFPKGAAYNASKFGLVGFTQAVMLDLRHHGVKVSTIMPGSVTSHFNNHEPGPEDAWKIQPEDLGQMTVDLLKMHPRTLPSKIEVRPTQPPRK